MVVSHLAAGSPQSAPDTLGLGGRVEGGKEGERGKKEGEGGKEEREK